jgi:hypothetical protein
VSWPHTDVRPFRTEPDAPVATDLEIYIQRHNGPRSTIACVRDQTTVLDVKWLEAKKTHSPPESSQIPLQRLLSGGMELRNDRYLHDLDVCGGAVLILYPPPDNTPPDNTSWLWRH